MSTLIVVVLLSAGCGSVDSDPVGVIAEFWVPGGVESLASVVAVSDAVIEFEVTEERRNQPKVIPTDGQSYSIGRTLVATVTSVVWSNPTMDTNEPGAAPIVGDSFKFSWGGWWQGSGEPRPEVWNEKYVEVGESYVAAFTNPRVMADGLTRLNVLTSDVIFESEDGTIVTMGRGRGDAPGFSGLRIEELATAIDQLPQPTATPAD